MRIRKAVFPVMLLGLLLLVTNSDDNKVSAEKKGPKTYSREQLLPMKVRFPETSVGVAVVDMNDDGHLDIISATPGEVRFFENQGDGAFVDRGVIVSLDVNFLNSGVGIAVGDVDSNEALDIIIATPGSIKIIKNPVSQKK